ncbi:MAG: NYN domain-containing protein [Thermoanaerobaculia bacterium]
MSEPETKRAIAFIDGQNLFHAAREAFGYSFPNYDPLRLAQEVCAGQGWQLAQVRFYTGVPDAQDNSFWNHFWTEKVAVLGTRKVFTYARLLRYQTQTVTLSDGRQHSYRTAYEKGIDVRIALDVVNLALEDAYDVGLIFSQDQDLNEVAQELRRIAHQQRRWIKLASAFPVSPTSRNRRGIDRTDWIRVDKATYDRCIDPLDYRPKRKPR